jgi:hypothetical protein
LPFTQKILTEKITGVDGWMDGWMDGWKTVITIAYSSALQKICT